MLTTLICPALCIAATAKVFDQVNMKCLPPVTILQLLTYNSDPTPSNSAPLAPSGE